MVYEDDTLKPCHKLSKQGVESYRKMLEDKGTEILFRHFHPFRFWFRSFVDFIKGLIRR